MVNDISEELIRQIASLKQEIGEVKGKVDSIAEDVSELKREMRDLNSFRWKQEGIRIGISFIVGVLGGILAILAYFRFR